VIVLARTDALAEQVRTYGSEVTSVRALRELGRAAEKFDAQVLVIDLDDAQGDLDASVNALRESRPQLVVIGLIEASSREFDEEVFDVVLEKHSDGSLLQRALKRTRRSRAT
jgi:AmiR/NasT family two-component response regulator